MGKSKKRLFNRNINNNGYILKRHDIINKIISDIRNNSLNFEYKNMVSLFGITIEEFSEADATLEELAMIRKLLF
ncbi:hypothetical protein IJ182_01580 [bacterium]|nr:hypothetical protein [bacterium]